MTSTCFNPTDDFGYFGCSLELAAADLPCTDSQQRELTCHWATMMCKKRRSVSTSTFTVPCSAQCGSTRTEASLSAIGSS